MGLFKKKELPDPIEGTKGYSVVVDKISKNFYRHDKEVNALKDVSFKIKEGEIFSIVGRSGSGKTTILNLLGAMEKPTSGRIALNGKTLGRLNEKELTEVRRSEVATIYQSYNLIPVLDAKANVELPMLLMGKEKEERSERAEKLLKIVGLGDRMDHTPDELSGGERERVAIARSLSNKPGILLADEPTSELDFEITEEIVELLEGINRDLGTTVIIVTHDLTLAERADRLLVLKQGEVSEIREGDGGKIRKEQAKTRKKKPSEYY